MWNPKVIDTDKVLYVAIADAIERDISLGILKPNDKMPPQRALAKIIGVNLTTISRAYKEAEKRGLIYGTVGRGTYIAQFDKKNLNLPQVLAGEDEILELGLIGSIKVPGYDLSKELKAVSKYGNLNELLDYVPSQGIRRHREVAAEWVRQYGLNPDPDNVVICGGATHAMNCCLLGLFAPGDRIAVDILTFTGFKNAAQMCHMKLEPVRMDEEGMVPESLEELCRKHPIKGIYLMPNMQNPTAASMSQARKQAIAEIIQRYHLILIEDDIYNFTNTSDQIALSALVPEQGIFICSISKALYPGLRIAFTVVPGSLLYQYQQAVTNTLWMAPTLSAQLVTQLIENGTARNMIEEKNQIIRSRMKIAKAALQNFNFQAKEGSPFLWLTLPEGWSCLDFEHAAMMNRVRVISAFKFYTGNQLPPNAVRISLGSVDQDEQLRKGLRILTNLLKQHSILTPSVM